MSRRAGLILFRLASAELDSASFETLDKLAEAAKSCPDMHIEVGGHASSEGSAEINQRLSLRRAQSVVDYLVTAGVDAAQLEPIGLRRDAADRPQRQQREHGQEQAHRVHRPAEVERDQGTRQGIGRGRWSIWRTSSCGGCPAFALGLVVGWLSCGRTEDEQVVPDGPPSDAGEVGG